MIESKKMICSRPRLMIKLVDATDVVVVAAGIGAGAANLSW